MLRRVEALQVSPERPVLGNQAAGQDCRERTGPDGDAEPDEEGETGTMSQARARESHGIEKSPHGITGEETILVSQA